MGLQTPIKIREFQRKPYMKAKNEPDYRFYQLYDKVYHRDILEHAYRLARHNGGGPDVDGVHFDDIESSGVEQWLAGLEKDLREKTYKPSAGYPKPTAENGHWASQRFGTEWRKPP